MLWGLAGRASGAEHQHQPATGRRREPKSHNDAHGNVDRLHHPRLDAPAMTSSPFSQPVAFTLRVLLDLGRYGSGHPNRPRSGALSTSTRRSAMVTMNCQG